MVYVLLFVVPCLIIGAAVVFYFLTSEEEKD